MRIIAGSARGVILKTPRGRLIRPSGGRIREALFSILGERVNGAVTIDLFAGSGALGLEALSRGAAKCYFVEINRLAYRCLCENLCRTSLEARAVVINASSQRGLRQLTGETIKADLVFLDPPYKRLSLALEALEGLIYFGVLNKKALVILEHGPQGIPDPAAAGYSILVEKKYGDSRITFLQQKCR